MQQSYDFDNDCVQPPPILLTETEAEHELYAFDSAGKQENQEKQIK
jgi:hypothetical protein